MTGALSMWAQFTGGGHVSLSPAYSASVATISGPQIVSCTVTFNNDGTVTGSKTGVGSNGPAAQHDWYAPSGGTPGAVLYMRATPTVGTFTTNGMSSFTLISGAPAISVTSPSGAAKSCTYTLDVATDAGGTNIIATQTGNVITADGT